MSSRNEIAKILADEQLRGDVLSGFSNAVLRGGLATAIGAPIDLGNGLLNAARMTYGFLGNKLGVLSPDQMPEPVENPWGGSEHVGNFMQEKGIIDGKRNAIAELLAGFITPATPKISASLGSSAEKVIEKAAKNATTTGEISRMPMAKQRGIFAGVGAKTADIQSLEKAKTLELSGVSPEEVWKKTGWGKAPDGKWRFEIPDDQASFRMDFDSLLPQKSNNYKSGTDVGVGGGFSHKPLYEAYPEILREERLNIGKLPSWMPDSSNSGSYKKGEVYVRNKDEGGAKSTLLHELQHAVQTREGLQSGGNQNNLDFDSYRRLAGEVEARLVQSRMNMTPEQRAAQYPWLEDYLKKSTGTSLSDIIFK